MLVLNTRSVRRGAATFKSRCEKLRQNVRFGKKRSVVFSYPLRSSRLDLISSGIPFGPNHDYPEPKRSFILSQES